MSQVEEPTVEEDQKDETTTQPNVQDDAQVEAQVSPKSRQLSVEEENPAVNEEEPTVTNSELEESTDVLQKDQEVSPDSGPNITEVKPESITQDKEVVQENVPNDVSEKNLPKEEEAKVSESVTSKDNTTPADSTEVTIKKEKITDDYEQAAQPSLVGQSVDKEQDETAKPDKVSKDDLLAMAECMGDGTTCVECGKNFSHPFYFRFVSSFSLQYHSIINI